MRINRNILSVVILFSFLFIILFLIFCRAKPDLISLFPLEKYDQDPTHWIKNSDSNFDKPIFVNNTKQHLENFYKHYIGSASPWNAQHVAKILQLQDNLKTIELEILAAYQNENKPAKKIGYAENYRPYSQKWSNDISKNINLTQFDHLKFDANNRAIAIDNLYVRALPTDDVYFYSHKIAGEGYPFDNLQISALWAGTPIYILGETIDHAWSLILSPDFIGWVKTNGIARANENFIKIWIDASVKHLAAIIKTKTSIIDSKNIYRFTSYVGSVFPAEEIGNELKLMIPVADNQHFADLEYAFVSHEQAAIIPLLATPHHFRDILTTLIGRPYGWGNLYFYNDCSGELKSLFTPFGIWLPRHSSDQIYAGKYVDISSANINDRLDYLMQNGRAFSTIIYVGDHIILFVGNFPNPNSKNHDLMSLTYQNMWGLRPHPPIRRAVIGQSVLFPLLERYPEDRSLYSQASKNYFLVSQLDDVPNELMRIELLDLRAMMFP